MKLSRFFRFDMSTIGLIIANIVTIIVAVVQKWNVIEVMWVYWAQSIIIGFFHLLKLWDSTKSSYKLPIPFFLRPLFSLLSDHIFLPVFFLAHYGFFHALYFEFIYKQGHPPSGILAISFAICILIFFVNHGISYWRNRSSLESNTGGRFFAPYVRIIPMHITLIFGSFYAKSMGTLVLFLILKTVADLIMHMVEHRE